MACVLQGYIFLPLDTQLPAHRLIDILNKAKPSILLHGHEVPTARWETVPYINVCERHGSDVRALPRWPPRRLQDVSYILPTSGSTGRTLLVQGTAQGIVNRLLWMEKHFPMSKTNSIVAFKTSPTFVDSIWEVFAPLVFGVQTVTISRHCSVLSESIAQHSVTHLVAVPTVWAILSTFPQKLTSLKLAVSSGEILSPRLARKLKSLLPKDTVLLNMYGTTEAAADVTWYEVKDTKPDAHYIPVGKPIDNMSIHIEADGEVCIGGIGLAKGYQGDPEATKCFFVGDTFRTGDLGFFNEDGDVCIRGRKTALQALVNGVRVDLTEVESVLLKHHRVISAAVRCWSSTSMVGYVVTAHNSLSDIELLEWCGVYLPDHSIPSSIQFLSEMPMTSSGKVNRHCLPKPLPITSEFQIAQVFVRALKTGLEPTSNIFLFGATSITAAHIAGMLDIPIEILYQYPTVRSLTQHLDPSRALTHVETPSVFPGLSADNQLLLKWKSKDYSSCFDAPVLLLSHKKCILASTHSGLLVCLNDTTGEEIWSFQSIGLRRAFGPIVYDSTTFVDTTDVAVIKRAYHGGTPISTMKLESRITCRCTVSDEIVWVVTDDGVLHILSPDLIEICEIALHTGCTCPVLPYPGSIAVICMLNGDVRCLHAHLQKRKVEEVWTVNVGAPIHAPAHLQRSAGKVVVATVIGGIFCLNVADGTLYWRHEIYNATVFLQPVLINATTLMIGTAGGSLIELLAENGNEIRRQELGHQLTGMASGEMYTYCSCSNGLIFLLLNNTLEVLGVQQLGHEVFSAPMIGRSEYEIAIGCRDNRVYMLDNQCK